MPISWWTKRIFLGWRHAVYFPHSSWNVVLLTVSTAEAVGHWQNTGFISTAPSVQQQLQPLSHYKPAGSLFWSVLTWQFSHGGFRFNITITTTFPNLLLSTQTNVPHIWMVWTIFVCFVWINVVFFIIMLSFTHLRVVQPSQENPYFDHHLYQLFL